MEEVPNGLSGHLDLLEATMRFGCNCAFVPESVLDLFATDETLSKVSRVAFYNTLHHSKAWRAERISLAPAARHAKSKPKTPVTPLRPNVLVFDCRESSSQPGDQIIVSELGAPRAARRVAKNMAMVNEFYGSIFARNSIDNNGMGLISSIRYGRNYCNAFWSGTQMIFGEGDGEIFLDFAGSEDVLAHEFAHAVTQYTIGLGFWGEAGAINESISDIFSAVYRQWQKRQTCEQADWMIGSDIVGPTARQRGFHCLRNLSRALPTNCISEQPKHYSDYDERGDPHINGGIPSFAFYHAAMLIGGNTWDQIAPVWYNALTTSQRRPNMNFREFAYLTITRAAALFPAIKRVAKAVEQGWKEVGVI